MGEIKSALELAMERSSKYVISEEDREAIRKKEILQKATSLFHRYQEGHIPLREIEKEIEKLDEGTRDPVKETLLSQWIESLSLAGGNDRGLDGIEAIRGRELKEVREKIHGLLREYGKKAEAKREETRQALVEALKRAGIYGEAVDPNVEGNEAWRNHLKALRHTYQEKLEEIKNVLKGSQVGIEVLPNQREVL